MLPEMLMLRKEAQMGFLYKILQHNFREIPLKIQCFARFSNSQVSDMANLPLPFLFSDVFLI